MSTDTNIFGGDTPATPAPNTNPATDFNQFLSMIVNENGEQKYKTVEEALKGGAHAQAYIAKLQADKAALEAQVQAATAAKSREAELEQTLQELLAKQGTPATPVDAPKPDDIAELVMKQLAARDAASKAKANQAEVASKLLEKFGTEAEAKYNSAAQELGLTVAELNDMAAKSPKAVLQVLGVGVATTRPNNVAPGQSAVNTAAFTPKTETLVKRNTERSQIGATTAELNEEARRSKAMVEELHAQGLSVGDLTDPKVYNKFFR